MSENAVGKTAEVIKIVFFSSSFLILSRFLVLGLHLTWGRDQAVGEVISTRGVGEFGGARIESVMRIEGLSGFDGW